MKELLNYVAAFIWQDDPSPEVSPEVCLDMIMAFSIPSTPCLSRLFAKLFGLAIMAGACLNKAPILFNILNSGSAVGFKTNAVYSELIMYCNAALYGLLRGNPFTAYGETMIVAFQVSLIITLVWKFQKVGMNEIIMAMLVFCAYLFFVGSIIPEDYYFLLLSVNLPILIYSKGVQIASNVQLKHTGNQSIVTHLMNFGGSLVRILTTIKEIGFDWAMLSGYIISVSLNSILVIQTILYMKNTKEYFEKSKKD